MTECKSTGSPEVSIIILNWNSWKDTIECLESIYKITYPKYNVIVIDNGSEDDSVGKIKEYCVGVRKVKSAFFDYDPNNKPIKIYEYTKSEIERIEENDNHDLPSNKNLIFIKNDKNYGFAEGCNIAMRYALNYLRTDYILLLNNDTVVDKEFLIELVKVAEISDKIGFTGPKIYYYDFNGRKDVLNYAGGKINMWTGSTPHIGFKKVDNGQYDQPEVVDYVEGSCLLAKNEVVRKIGMIDLAYFTYWEETDWCMRGSRAGYRSIYVPKARIWHKIEISGSKVVKVYYFTKNRFLFMKRYAHSLEMYFFLLYFFGAYFWFLSFVLLIYDRDIRLFKCFLRGVRDGVNIKNMEVKYII